MTESANPPCGEMFPLRDLPIIDFTPNSYIISLVLSNLLDKSHFRCLCQLKVLGHFANKNWFSKQKFGER